MEGAGWVLAAAVAFDGTHFLLSHPLRRPIVAAVGDRGFSGVYSLIALATFVWMIVAYRAAPPGALLWPANNALWAAVSVIMLIASILLVGSFFRNPALPGGGSPTPLPEAARGVYAVTRHPMLWAFALWGLCHIAVFPVTKNIIVAGAITLLSLLGAVSQDAKKTALQPNLWPAWQAKTSYWPFAAIAAGRARFGGFGWRELAGGLVVWLASTWLHKPISGWAAGIWHWI